MSIATLLKLDDTGVKVADYADILADLTSTFKGIYGADAQIGPETKDGQWLASIAAAIRDTGNMAAGVYNNMNPNTATGDAFDRWLTLQGLDRKTPTQSAVNIFVVVTNAAKTNNTKFGRVIISEPNNPGVTWVWDGNTPAANSAEWRTFQSGADPQWFFQATAYASVFGPVYATIKPNESFRIESAVTQKSDILYVFAGLFAFTSTGTNTTIGPVQYAIGNELESVEAAKIRRAKSHANNATSVVRALEGKLATVPGVQDARIYENATDTIAPVAPTSTMQQEPHSILCLIRSPYIGAVGADRATVAKLVANTIEAKKGGGCGLSVGIGNTAFGTPVTVGKIKFVLAKPVALDITIDVSATNSWSASLETLIRAAITKYVGEVPLGQTIYEPDITCIVKNVIETNGGGGAVAGAGFIVNSTVTDRWDGGLYFYAYPMPTITFRLR